MRISAVGTAKAAVPIFFALSAGAALAQSDLTTKSLDATRSAGNSSTVPAPQPTFGGTIDKNAASSTPWWPPKLVAPPGAPNVLVVLLDDAGFAASGTFGGPIPNCSYIRSIHKLTR